MLTRLQHPEEFKTGLRILIRMTRNKDGGKGNVDRHALKYITRSPEEFDRKLNEMLLTADDNERVYSTVDERDVNKSIRIFKHRQLDAEYDEDPTDFYRDFSNRWLSCLQSPQARKGSLFLWDCDERQDFNDLMHNLLPLDVILHWYETKNGHHIITKPFEYPKKVPERYHKLLHKNALILWAY